MPSEDPKGTVMNAMLKYLEAFRWTSVRAAFNLHGPVAAERLAALLAMHLLLDRAVTEVIARRLLDPRLGESLEKTEAAVSRVGFDNRVKMAKAAHLISESCAADLMAVNSVRNRFAHSQPKDSEEGDGITPEISSHEDFNRYMERGERAFTELNGILIEHVVEPPTLIDPPTTTK